MIHTTHTMTVEQYAKFDETKNEKYLRRWFNILPVSWFKKRTGILVSDIAKQLNQESKSMIRKGIFKLHSLNRLMQITNFYNAIYNILVVKNRNNMLFEMIGKKPSYTIPASKLSFYIREVKQITGIKINDLTGLERLNKDIERRHRLFKQTFDKAFKPQEPVPFIELVMRICSFMNVGYNHKMNLHAFIGLNNEAVEKIKSLEQQKNAGHNKHRSLKRGN